MFFGNENRCNSFLASWLAKAGINVARVETFQPKRTSLGSLSDNWNMIGPVN